MALRASSSGLGASDAELVGLPHQVDDLGEAVEAAAVGLVTGARSGRRGGAPS